MNGFTILSIETSFCFIFLTVMSCFKEFTEVFTWLEDCKLDLFEKVVPFYDFGLFEVTDYTELRTTLAYKAAICSFFWSYLPL